MGLTLLNEDMRDALDFFAATGEQFDAVVTDPPYHLTNNTGTRSPYPGQYTPIGKPSQPKGGFMGKTWDGGDIAMRAETWRAVFAVMKPGAHLLAFGGTRTFHRMACAIEDAGFDLRDTLVWMYGTGFPKSHNLPGGLGTALKPAWEPIVLARKPLVGTVAQNVLGFGTGALNIDGCRVGETKRVPGSLSKTENAVYGKGLGGYRQNGTESGHNPNIGRWPANVVHDGSDEVEAAFAAFGDRPGQQGKASSNPDSPRTRKVYGTLARSDDPMEPRGDTGTASRFFYSAKATAADRAGSKHPTVKPIALMRWLVRLVTPPGGTVLDPFAGSGTTAAACHAEGFSCVLVEREAEYAEDIRRRLSALAGT